MLSVIESFIDGVVIAGYLRFEGVETPHSIAGHKFQSLDILYAKEGSRMYSYSISEIYPYPLIRVSVCVENKKILERILNLEAKRRKIEP